MPSEGIVNITVGSTMDCEAAYEIQEFCEVLPIKNKTKKNQCFIIIVKIIRVFNIQM